MDVVLYQHLNGRLDLTSLLLRVYDKNMWDESFIKTESGVKYYVNIERENDSKSAMKRECKVINATLTELNRLGFCVVHAICKRPRITVIRVSLVHSADDRPSITKHYC